MVGLYRIQQDLFLWSNHLQIVDRNVRGHTPMLLDAFQTTERPPTPLSICFCAKKASFTLLGMCGFKNNSNHPIGFENWILKSHDVIGYFQYSWYQGISCIRIFLAFTIFSHVLFCAFIGLILAVNGCKSEYYLPDEQDICLYLLGKVKLISLRVS